MIKVKNIVNVVKNVVLLNSPIVDDETVILQLVEQGLSEIYRKFNLEINTETVSTECNTYFYKLTNDDVNFILGVFDDKGVPIPTSDTIDSKVASYKLVNTTSFTLNRPCNGTVFCVYASSPPEISSVEDTVPIPRAFETALVMYIGYLANTAVTASRDDIVLADTYQNRYLSECNTLIMEGYKVDLNVETYSAQYKGFV